MKTILISITFVILFLPRAYCQQKGIGLGGVMLSEHSKKDEYQSLGSGLYKTSKKEYSTYLIPTVSFLKFHDNGHFFLFETGKFNVSIRDKETTYMDDVGDVRVVGGELIFNFTSSFRVGYNFVVSESEKLSTYLGFGINPQFSREVVDPEVFAFKTANTSLDTDLEILGSLFLKLDENIFLNLVLPIKIWNYNLISFRTDNPQLPLEQQRELKNQSTFFPLQIEFKVGLVYTFQKLKESKSK